MIFNISVKIFQYKMLWSLHWASIWSEAVQEFHIISDEKLIRSQLRSCHCEKPGTISLRSQQSDTQLMVTQPRYNKENISNIQPKVTASSVSPALSLKWLADLIISLIWRQRLGQRQVEVMIGIGTATPGSLHSRSGLALAPLLHWRNSHQTCQPRHSSTPATATSSAPTWPSVL